MKTTLAGIAAAALLATGFGALETAAAAAPQYVPTVKTSFTVKREAGQKNKSFPKKKAVKFQITVKATGTAKPVGTLKLTVQRKNGRKWVAATKKDARVLTVSRTYAGAPQWVNLGRFKKPGKYRVVVAFTGKPGTVFKSHKANHGFTVLKR